jgi:hypothetical protein
LESVPSAFVVFAYAVTVTGPRIDRIDEIDHQSIARDDSGTVLQSRRAMAVVTAAITAERTARAIGAVAAGAGLYLIVQAAGLG